MSEGFLSASLIDAGLGVSPSAFREAVYLSGGVAIGGDGGKFRCGHPFLSAPDTRKRPSKSNANTTSTRPAILN
jgi:hypothetical protein